MSNWIMAELTMQPGADSVEDARQQLGLAQGEIKADYGPVCLGETRRLVLVAASAASRLDATQVRLWGDPNVRGCGPPIIDVR